MVLERSVLLKRRLDGGHELAGTAFVQLGCGETHGTYVGNIVGDDFKRIALRLQSAARRVVAAVQIVTSRQRKRSAGWLPVKIRSR